MDRSIFTKFIRFIPVPVYIKNKEYIYTYWNSGFAKFQVNDKFILSHSVKRTEKFLLHAISLLKYLYNTAGKLLSKYGKNKPYLIIYNKGNSFLSLCKIKPEYQNNAARKKHYGGYSAFNR